MNKPRLIVITGRPGSGKTTLAHAVAKAVHCPAFCRDEFKEGYVITDGGSHASLGKEANLQIYEAFFQAIDLMISNGFSLVIEAAFQQKLWAPRLMPLIERTRMAVIICSVDPQVAGDRFIKRAVEDPTRMRFHGDQAVPAARDRTQLPIEEYIPPMIPAPTLNVNTTEGYAPSMDQIVSFAMQSKNQP